MAMLTSLCLFSCTPEENDNGEDGGQTETKVTYTVTVTDDKGNPIKGAILTFSPKGGTPIPYPTDAEGKASYRTDKEMSVTVTTIPAGYEYDKVGVAQSFDSEGKLSVVLSKADQSNAYVIKVVDEKGSPLSGVRVQMCDAAGSCRMPVVTGADGTASYPYEAGEFHAQLTALPDGYTVDDVAAYYDFEDGVATITLTKIAD